MARALLLIDGPSDAPLGMHVERLALSHGCNLDVVAPDLRRISPAPGHRVSERLSAVLAFDEDFDLIIVHRDAESQSPEERRQEIETAISEVCPDLPHLPVVPVRMTDSWLLVDEDAIRHVAGRPSGNAALNLPPLHRVEQIANAKEQLERALVTAAGVSGRRLKAFKRDFGGQRRRLLEGLDHEGPVSQLSAWQELCTAVEQTVSDLS